MQKKRKSIPSYATEHRDIFVKLSTVSTRSHSLVETAVSKLITSYIKLERGEKTLQTLNI